MAVISQGAAAPPGIALSPASSGLMTTPDIREQFLDTLQSSYRFTFPPRLAGSPSRQANQLMKAHRRAALQARGVVVKSSYRRRQRASKASRARAGARA